MKPSIKRLKALPRRSDEIWQGGLIRMAAWVTEEDSEPYRPYYPMWVAVRADKVHGGKLLKPHERNFTAAVESLLAFACEDSFGGYRPGSVEVEDPALAEHLSGVLAETGIEVRLVERLEAVERVLESMQTSERGGENRIPGPLDGPNVNLEDVRRFAEAAAAFYRAVPWQYLTDVDLIHIEQPDCPQGMEYTVVLGAGRSVFGLGFYRDMADYFRFRQAASEGMRAALDPSGIWQLSFNPVTEIPPQDADLWEDQDLPVAGSNAYPLVMRFGARGRITRPGGAELRFLEALLRSFSEMTESEIDTGRWEKEISLPDGTVRVVLAIPDLLDPPSSQEWMERGFMPDRRAHESMFADMNRYFRDHPPADEEEMQRMAESLFSGKKVDELVTHPETPLDRAQELCFRAFDTHGRRRVQLAREALEVCPDCADAYVILAEQGGTLEAELDYYTKGIAAGKRALGAEAFEEHVGHFWGVSETRPYMRARFGLAQSLEQTDRIEEAVEHYQELLRLNPGDNQGVRYLLMPRLLELDRDVEAARLLKESEEESANWMYARALLAFRLSGKSTAARRELRAALRTNPHVPECLLQQEEFAPVPERYSPGSPEEAMICAEELRPAFEKTEGSLKWLAAEHHQREREQSARQREKLRKERQKKKKRKRR